MNITIIFVIFLLFHSLVIIWSKTAYCGRPIGTEFRLEERIIAGYDVGYYRYPWFAALMKENIVSCGGVLIGPRFILTAAHCFKEYILNNNSKARLEDVYHVKMGVYNICKNETTQKTYKVDKVYIHEKYKEYSPYYDIALLILTGSTDDYEPICLPRTAVKTRPKDGTVPGLGTIRYHGSLPCTLHEARILIYPDEDCRQMINRTGNDPKKIGNSFCAGYLQGGIDACQGDSGGPLQVFDDNGNYVLLGIVSFGFHCANPGLLGMYTDISRYLDWIQEKTGLSDLNQANNSNAAANMPHKKLNPIIAPIKIIIIRRKKLIVISRNVKQIPIAIIKG